MSFLLLVYSSQSKPSLAMPVPKQYIGDFAAVLYMHSQQVFIEMKLPLKITLSTTSVILVLRLTFSVFSIYLFQLEHVYFHS